VRRRFQVIEWTTENEQILQCTKIDLIVH
jgi:hypothetical protein